MVVVNDEYFLQGDVQQVKAMLEAQTKKQVGEDAALERAVSDVLVLQEAQRRGISVTDEEAEQHLEQVIAKQGLTLEKVKGDITSKGESYEKSLENYKDLVIIERVIKDVTSDIEVSDEEARAYYDAKKDVLFTGAVVMPYENIAGQLKLALAQQKQQQEFSDFVNSLKESADIEYL
ncbi:MAG: hypothetical protein KJ718_04425 [Nanoarchaeota archaeon]|nr:hypothetical protein [Nanoarchaeota archaeon]MBU1051775.1 hypothetical protein [Nanoarchaeota archaeon]MBU1988344.1 hypothetical protein [Nanoarchaeota archaeon]